MTDDIKRNITAMIYHLNNEDHAKADKYLEKAVSLKVKNVYSQEYSKVKQSFSKENI